MKQENVLDRMNIRSIKAKQKEVIKFIEKGESVLALIPTGGGKSLCYQYPALTSNKLTVVIQPLIALIEDQYKYLKGCGFKVTRYCSNVSKEERDECLNNIQDTRILFTTPESLTTEGSTLYGYCKQMETHGLLERIVFDEAHCLSTWGRGFRPSYQLVANRCKELFSNIKITALTATATAPVKKDILTSLGIPETNCVEACMYRKNLHIEVHERPSVKQMVQQIVRMFHELCTDSQVGIIYSLSRADCEKYAKLITQAGVKTMAYHAGLDNDERSLIQSKWQSGKIQLVVATVAFGMGIDKSCVRLVVHTQMPIGSIFRRYKLE